MRVRIGKLALDPLSFDAALDRMIDLAKNARGAYVVTPNADHVVRAEHDPGFVAICDEADLVLADGMPLLWAAALQGSPLPAKVSGSDVMPALCRRAAAHGLKVFLLGGLGAEAAIAAENLRAASPGLHVAGTYSPPFGFEQDAAECRRIVDLVNASGAHIIFVGVGSPKQERWIARWRTELQAGVLLGVGISIAFAAGTRRRAPRLMQKTGTEWLFRLAQEPRRLAGRYLRDFQIFAIALRGAWRARLG